MDENGSEIVPEDSAVQVGENEEITLPGGGTVDKDGNVSGDEEITAHRIVLDEDGNATVVSPTDGTYTVIFAAYDKNGVLTSIKLVIQEFAVGFTPVSSPEDFKPNENGTVKYIITQILNSALYFLNFCPFFAIKICTSKSVQLFGVHISPGRL